MTVKGLIGNGVAVGGVIVSSNRFDGVGDGTNCAALAVSKGVGLGVEWEELVSVMSRATRALCDRDLAGVGEDKIDSALEAVLELRNRLRD